jgi:hypothetical protein
MAQNRLYGRKMPRTRILWLCVGQIACSVAFGMGCVSHTGNVNPARTVITAPASSMKEKWGIEITSLRMSGNGHLIDFRYRVLDPVKAGTLADRKYSPCMIDQATGTKLVVPNTPKLGPLRQSASRLEAGKIYFMLFANSGRLVKSGSKVTITIGDFKAENLSVQ